MAKGSVQIEAHSCSTLPGELDTPQIRTPTPEVPRRTSLVRNLKQGHGRREYTRPRAPKSTTEPPSQVSPAKCRRSRGMHAILSKQGRWGRGAVPPVRYWCVGVSSVGGKGEAKNISFFFIYIMR